MVRPARLAEAGRRAQGGRWALAISMCIALHIGPAHAQTLFTPPDSAVDVSKYATIEECIAATARVRESAERQERRQRWSDTLPWNPAEQRHPLPGPVITTAKGCSAHLLPETLPLSNFGLAVPLYLIADRDKDVSTLVSRRLAAAAHRAGTKSGVPIAELERVGVLDTLFQALLEAKPARMAAADSLVRAFDRSIPRPMQARPAAKVMGMYVTLAGRAQVLDDTVTMRARGMRAVALLDSLAPAERRAVRESEFDNASDFDRFVYSAYISQAGYGVMLDSLRRSTRAYVMLQQSLWVNATGERPEASGFPIGRQAPKLVTTTPAGATGDARPVPGKVNLIVFIDAMCTDVIPQPMRLNAVSECRPETSSLRRISALFPALEITLVDRTRGYFMYLPPMTAQDEAEQIGKAFAAHHVPGTPVIGTTEFFRLAAPDRRRIESKQLPNFTPYTFGKSWSADRGAAFLIDRQGTIILPAGGITGSSEKFVTGLIAALLSQRDASPGAESTNR